MAAVLRRLQEIYSLVHSVVVLNKVATAVAAVPECPAVVMPEREVPAPPQRRLGL